MDTRDVLLQASELIKEKRYKEARAMLVKVDHPVAEQWLNKIDALMAKEKSTPSSAPMPAKTKTPPSQSTSQSTPIVAATPTPKPKATHEKTKNSAHTLPTAGIIIGFLVAVIGGIGGGILLLMSSRITYIIFGSPLIAAGILGLVMGQSLKMTKVRDVLAAAIFAALMGGLAYGTFRYGEYLDFVQIVHDETIVEYGELTPAEHAELDEYLNDMLVEATGQSGFIGYVLLEGQEGMTVTGTRYGTESESIWSKEATYLYWGFEILVFLIAPAAVVYNMISEPFCEETGTWMKFQQIGTVSYDRSQQFLALINEGYFADASHLMYDDRKLARKHLFIRVGRCHSQSPDAIIRIQQQAGRSTKEIVKRTITAEQYDDLVAKVM